MAVIIGRGSIKDVPLHPIQYMQAYYLYPIVATSKLIQLHPVLLYVSVTLMCS